MEKMILIKYGELTTKKGNRNFFVKTLKNNLKYQNIKNKHIKQNLLINFYLLSKIIIKNLMNK